MNEIRRLDPDSYEWATRIPLKQWTMSHAVACRYGMANTNQVECLNGVFKGARQLPITCIVQHTFTKVILYFDQRRELYKQLLQSGERFTPHCMAVIRERTIKANKHSVANTFDRSRGIFEVNTAYDHRRRKGGNLQVVTLSELKCTCGKFQGTKIPCSHAIAACMTVAVDYYQYVDSSYTLEQNLACYQSFFQPVGHPDYWPDIEGPSLIPNQAMRREKGRPKSGRIRNEMDERDQPSKQKCSICGAEGHNRRRCLYRSGASTSGASTSRG
jgi:hypothetical protein